MNSAAEGSGEILLHKAKTNPDIGAKFAELKSIRDKITLKGEEALKFIRSPQLWDKRDPPEIMVKNRLPLWKAIGIYT